MRNNSRSGSGGAGVAPKRRCCGRIGSENLLLILTVVGVVIGTLMGLLLKDDAHPMDKKTLSYWRFPGELFMRMLKMLILPLIVSSIVYGSVVVRTVLVSDYVGIILVMTIQPGKLSKVNIAEDVPSDRVPCISTALDTVLDLMRNVLPSNLVQATFENAKTCGKFFNSTGNITTQVLPEVVLLMDEDQRAILLEVPEIRQSRGMNILGVVFFSVALGLVLSSLGAKGKPLKDFFWSLEAVSMRLISLVIWFSPIGISFLIAVQILAMEDPARELKRLVGYMITVVLGLLIHGLVILPAMLYGVTRRNPLTYVYGMAQALVTACATSSSSATLPLSIKCVEENNGVDSRVARFVLPLGATINMDGTALYEAVATLYIAQAVGKELTIGGVIIVSLTATIASIGAAGIPQAGIVTMIMVLIAIGLPTNLFVLILPVDFLLDRIRTTVNVHGDSIGAAIVERWCRGHLSSTVPNLVDTDENDIPPPRRNPHDKLSAV